MRARPSLIALSALLTGFCSAQSTVETSDAFGINLSDHWYSPWQHTHLSPAGTPYLHNFGYEPAFLGRDLIINYGWAEHEAGSEQEVELELEWALTRRLGFVIEQGYHFENPSGAKNTNGLGDLAFVPRFLIVESDRFLASANLEIAAPTGSSAIEAGEEWHLAPFLTTWTDLGGWWTMTTATGFEFALDSNETEFFASIGLTKSFRIHDPHLFCSQTEGAHGHNLPTGVLSLIAELSVSGVIDGDPKEENVFAAEALLGLNYAYNDLLDIRAGYLFPLNNNSDLEQGVIIGAVHHF